MSRVVTCARQVLISLKRYEIAIYSYSQLTTNRKWQCHIYDLE